MRTVQTLTTRQIASGIAKSEDPDSNPNEAPNSDRVDAINRRLVNIAEEHGFDPDELRGDQPATVQSFYLDDPVPELVDHDG